MRFSTHFAYGEGLFQHVILLYHVFLIKLTLAFIPAGTHSQDTLAHTHTHMPHLESMRGFFVCIMFSSSDCCGIPERTGGDW